MVVVYYVNSQERKPQAQRDWLEILQGRAHNVREVDVCALSVLHIRRTTSAARMIRTPRQERGSTAWCVSFARP